MSNEAVVDIPFIDKLVEETGTSKRNVIALLHRVQKKYNYLPEEALRRICEITEITPAQITGVSTFYTQFRHTPAGKHIIQVCIGTACHVKGAGLVIDAFRRELRIPRDADTDTKGLFTLQNVACLGCCTLAPVVQIDEVVYGYVKPDRVSRVIKDFLNRDSKISGETIRLTGGNRGEIRVGFSSCCIASGSRQVHQALEKTLSDTGIDAALKRVGCVGMCYQDPLVEVRKPDQEPVLYTQVEAKDVRKIVLDHFNPPSFWKKLASGLQKPVEALFTGDDIVRVPHSYREEQIDAYLGRQHHIVTEFCGEMDPLDMGEYLARGGFSGLQKCLLQQSPGAIIESVKSSGLRGRGGAGFSTGDKWELVRNSEDDVKYVVCNGDEGDPGAFMDRMILESYPFRVLEGMAVAACAVGAHEGYLYIRAEYPLAVERIRDAIRQCEETGWLGDNIRNSRFSLKLHIMEGAGAFVCGEETALLQSIEGRRGMPVYRPPYPSEKGLWGRPTLVNNCETYATIPWIMKNGPEALSQFGSKDSKGTKVFALAGKIMRGGLIEVPMGITIREIVEDIGGGIEGGKTFKAVQIGGPSGGCIPANLADTPIDYDALTETGAMMGSGGLLVMDESDCMVDIAKYFLTFTYDQSCGKCTYCRIGTHQMLQILEKITGGEGTEADLKALEEIADKTRDRSLCGLGKTAPNPVLTTLRYFREEYEAHLQGRCPAGRCKALIRFEINKNCIGCTICSQKCPADAIPLAPYEAHEINQEKCIKCATCKSVCPNDAVSVI